MLHIFAAVHQLQDWIIRNTGANHSHSQRSERCWRSEISSVLAIYSNPLWISPKIRSYWALLRTFPINWHATVISFDCRPDENNTSSLFIGSTFIAKDNKSPFAEEWQRNSALINWNSRQLHSAKTILFLIFIRWTQRIKMPGYEDFSGNTRTTILCIRSDTFLLNSSHGLSFPNTRASRIWNKEYTISNRYYWIWNYRFQAHLPDDSTASGLRWRNAPIEYYCEIHISPLLKIATLTDFPDTLEEVKFPVPSRYGLYYFWVRLFSVKRFCVNEQRRNPCIHAAIIINSKNYFPSPSKSQIIISLLFIWWW